MMVLSHVVVVVFLVYAESNNRFQNFFHMSYTGVPQFIGKFPYVGGVQSQLPFHGALIFPHLEHSHDNDVVLGQLHILGANVLFHV